jgi:hypothetical protein
MRRWKSGLVWAELVGKRGGGEGRGCGGAALLNVDVSAVLGFCRGAADGLRGRGLLPRSCVDWGLAVEDDWR